MKPLIGITTGEIQNLAEPWSPITYGQSHTYSDIVIRAGGVPVLIPIIDDAEVILQLFQKLDGLLLAGGNDLNPKLYGQESYDEKAEYSDHRDKMEVLLAQKALQERMPILAICRGMQLLNVICGGSLHQDIKTELKTASDHEISTHRKTLVDLAHQLRVEPASKLAAIIQSNTIAANSHHHQAIRELASDFTVSARSEDGLIEAIETKGDGYVVGFQCHPESLNTVEPKWNFVFKAFIESAQS